MLQHEKIFFFTYKLCLQVKLAFGSTLDVLCPMQSPVA